MNRKIKMVSLGLEPASLFFLTKRFNRLRYRSADRPLTSSEIEYFSTTDYAKTNIYIFQKIFPFFRKYLNFLGLG